MGSGAPVHPRLWATLRVATADRAAPRRLIGGRRADTEVAVFCDIELQHACIQSLPQRHTRVFTHPVDIAGSREIDEEDDRNVRQDEHWREVVEHLAPPPPGVRSFTIELREL
jgi:hypothetical protein